MSAIRGEDGYQRFLEGTPPSRIPLRVVARHLTSHPEHPWLNRLQCVKIGEADLENWVVSYDVYALK